jgi:hypothetical protein
VKYCEQFTPPGCDCFGCCTVETPSGPVHVFLNSGPDCSFDNLDGCQSCTPQIEECGNPCNPDECEVCFGETEVPDECPGGQQCDSGITCKDNADCPSEYYCYLGCCYPPPEG